MSATNTLADVLKSVATATSLSGLSTLLCDSSGALAKTGTILVNSSTVSNLDLNDVRDWRITGLDTLSGNVLNAPTKAAGLVLIGLGNYHIILRAGEGGVIYFRSYNNGWQAWQKVTMTKLS